MQGPTVVLRFDMVPAYVTGDLVSLGGRIVTAVGSTMPSLQGERGPEDDPLLYDMNMYGVVDQLDQDILIGDVSVGGKWLGETEPGFDVRFDLNGDLVIDASDVDLFGILAPDAAGGTSGAVGDERPLRVVPGDVDGADFEAIVRASTTE